MHCEITLAETCPDSQQKVNTSHATPINFLELNYVES